MQNAREKFRQEGIGLAAISYDSDAILRDFTQRHGIEYPLIADPDSSIIRSYGVLNREATGFTKGMALPGYFYILPDGAVKEKYFETAYTDRYTAGNLLLKLFPQLVEGNGREVPAPYIRVTLFQSDEVVVPGVVSQWRLRLPCRRIRMSMLPERKDTKRSNSCWKNLRDLRFPPLRYPDAKVLFLPAIKESVPVYEGTFRLLQDVVVSADRGFITSLTQPKTITLTGTLFYQACDSEKCYMPQKSAVSWPVQVMPLDRVRAPEAIQHK